MYNRQFFGSKLGQAALASVVAMTAMIALTTQMNSVELQTATFAQPSGVILTELA